MAFAIPGKSIIKAMEKEEKKFPEIMASVPAGVVVTVRRKIGRRYYLVPSSDYDTLKFLDARVSSVEITVEEHRKRTEYYSPDPRLDSNKKKKR